MIKTDNFYQLGLQYSDLVLKIIDYFSVNSLAGKDVAREIKDRTVLHFLESNYRNPDKKGEFLIQPSVINEICDILVSKNCMSKLRSDGGLGIGNNYICTPPATFSTDSMQYQNYYNSMIFGFEYIYEKYKDIVVPIVWDKGEGDYAAATGFKYLSGIVTAKHCITDIKNLMIKGFKADQLNGNPIYVHKSEGVDVAYIETGRILNTAIYFEEGRVLQDVLVMGYPKIPAFTDLITAEKASIAAKADTRQTTTKGSIASFGHQYLMNCDMMLITAKISGGNSGGPVINEHGTVIGVTSCLSDSEGDYDNLGYGVVTPIKYLFETLEEPKTILKKDADFFKDWIW